MKGHAPVTGDQIHKVLRDLGVEIRLRDGNADIAVIGDREIRIPKDRRKSEAPDQAINHLARALEVSRKELLDALFDRAPIKMGRSKAALPVRSVNAPSKAELLNLCSEHRSLIGEIEQWLQSSFASTGLGQQVVKVLTSCREDLHAAAKRLRAWPPSRPDQEYASPDDAGYRPTRYDPVTTGVARAVGIAASAATRRTTVTKWQHDERSTS